MNFDLHCHFSLKPANSKSRRNSPIPDPDHWSKRLITSESIPSVPIDGFLPKIVIGSQAHGKAQEAGKCRIVCNSFYPIELGFLELPISIAGKNISTLAGIHPVRLNHIRTQAITYYDALLDEYNNLLDASEGGAMALNEKKIVLTSNYHQLLQTLNQQDKIAVINSVEGINAFAEYDQIINHQRYSFDFPVDYDRVIKSERECLMKYSKTKNLEDNDNTSYFDDNDASVLKEFIQRIKRNIGEVKKLKFAPIFVGLAHHFYNHITGHCSSIQGVFKQNENIYTAENIGGNIQIRSIRTYDLGIHPWGVELVHQLLRRDSAINSKRILIDTKHMTVKGRQEYYSFVQHQKDNFNDRIPIIQSHTTCNGKPSIQHPKQGKNISATQARLESIFPPDDLGLFDDEVKIIVESDGLIGLQLDEKRLLNVSSRDGLLPPECIYRKWNSINRVATRKAKKIRTFSGVTGLSRIIAREFRKTISNQISAFHHSNNEYVPNVNPVENLSAVDKKNLSIAKKVYCGVILRHIFHMVKCGGQSTWEHLSIGTDFEGLISGLVGYERADYLDDLRRDLLAFWNENADGTADLLCSEEECEEVISTYSSMGRTSEERERRINQIFVLNGMNFLKKYFTDEYLLHGINPRIGWVLTEEEESLYLL